MPLKAHFVFVVALLGCLGASLALPAHADLTICNQTAEPAGVAVAMKSNKIWQSNGWWTLEPGRCKALLKGQLTEARYFLHAVHYNAGGQWDGDTPFCIDRGSFSIEGRLDCNQRGYETAGFFEIRTNGKAHWQHNLADASGSSAHGEVLPHPGTSEKQGD